MGGGKGEVPSPRPVKGGGPSPPHIEPRGITLFKSETEKYQKH